MGPISTRKMNGILVVWDQYLPENMKWHFGNLGLISSNKSPDGQCWKFSKGQGGGIIMDIIAGGSKAFGANDRFEKIGHFTWWNLNKIFEILNYVDALET